MSNLHSMQSFSFMTSGRGAFSSNAPFNHPSYEVIERSTQMMSQKSSVPKHQRKDMNKTPSQMSIMTKKHKDILIRLLDKELLQEDYPSSQELIKGFKRLRPRNKVLSPRSV